MDQHFLPECYLKEFCDNGEFYKIDCSLLHLNKKPYPRKVTPAAICYDKDFCTLTPEFKNLYTGYQDFDPLFLEEKFFLYENKYPGIINKIKNGDSFLNIDDAKTFLYSCLDFKIRNNYFRDIHSDLRRNTLNDPTGIIKYKTDPEFQKVKDRFNISQGQAIDIIDGIRFNILNDDNFTKNSHIAALVARYTSNYSHHDVIISNLLYYKWKFILSNNEFITSDNPGWSLDKNNQVHNTKFDKDFQFLMPITPRHCLAITDSELDLEYYNNPTKKKLYAGYQNKDIIDGINGLSINHFKKYLFSTKKETGEKICNILKIR
jgi:hypothetical protein